MPRTWKHPGNKALTWIDLGNTSQIDIHVGLKPWKSTESPWLFRGYIRGDGKLPSYIRGSFHKPLKIRIPMNSTTRMTKMESRKAMVFVPGSPFEKVGKSFQNGRFKNLVGDYFDPPEEEPLINATSIPYKRYLNPHSCWKNHFWCFRILVRCDQTLLDETGFY